MRKDGQVVLSERLQMLARMVTPGSPVADVGCDHGFLPIYLVQNKVTPHAYALDVREGPLAAAREHVESFGLGTYIETRLSDGLAKLKDGEAETLICAGMGGRLIQRILRADIEKVRGMREVILQPQSEWKAFRIFLRREGFRTVAEDAVYDDGKYYFAVKAVYAGKDGKASGDAKKPEMQSIFDEYGELLLCSGHPVLRQYVAYKKEGVERILEKLETENGPRTARRVLELGQELAKIETVSDMLWKGRCGMSMVHVIINGEQREYAQGTSYEAIAADCQKGQAGMIALAAENGKIRELFKKVTKNCSVEFFTLRDEMGHKTYVRTAVMLFLKSIYDVFGAEASQSCCVEFTIGNGLYVNAMGKVPATEESADRLKDRMRELVEKKIPFMKKSYPLEEAMELFRNKGMKDKERLFHYRMSSQVNIYEIDGYYDYYYGYMLPNTGYVKWFGVMPYEEGFMLLLPSRKQPDIVEPFEERRKLFETMENSQDWGRKAAIETVGDLNDQICSGSMSDLILIQEAEQERKIGEIAKDIVDRGDVKFVMIAGPSSSGKTSFSHRLSIQLRTLGKSPHPIALDDYFVNREETPRDENGDYNFECLGAIDVKKFNDDMVKLLAGERVELPTFNFKTGQREYRGNYKQLAADDILVIEGIHGLNPQMSYALPNESKYKIYISALTTLNVDNHNRIPTTDGRLLRRMVRDARTRGSSAQRTIHMWPSVRRGEEENIFPFQEEADAMFNSAQIFELSVLKTFAEPLLFQIPKDVPEYYEAKRLLKFLDYFLGVPSESLPNNSICREFVGGSCFNV